MTATDDFDFTEAVVERFIKDELRFLNRNDLDSWIDLYTDDGVYFMPLDEDQANPAVYDMIFYDNKPLMRIRRENFGHPLSPSMEYPIRSMRMISDCEILAKDTDSCRVETPFIASIFYQEVTWYSGVFFHDLVRRNDTIKIRQKQVNLLNMGSPQGVIVTYL